MYTSVHYVIIGSDDDFFPSSNPNQCWPIVGETLRSMQWNYIRNSNIFIQENASENVVCKILAIKCLDPKVLAVLLGCQSQISNNEAVIKSALTRWSHNLIPR